MSAQPFQLTPVRPQDEGFLRALYASHRGVEVQQWGWDAAQTDAFLALQFKAQHVGYAQQFGAENDRIVRLDGRPVGRFFVARVRGALRLVDIALLPAHQGQGLGTLLVQHLLTVAQAQGVEAQLSVARHNAALRLYCRLGFTVVDQDELQ